MDVDDEDVVARDATRGATREGGEGEGAATAADGGEGRGGAVRGRGTDAADARAG